MGSPISPFFADIVMDDLVNYFLSVLNKDFNSIPVFYYRYVDDIILCVRNLQFTFELEQDKRINFLDMTLIRNNNMIITNWFRKQTSSNRVINYSSNHLTQQKKNIVFNLVDRAILLSHHEFHHENLCKVIQILKHNNYPSNFIDQNIKIRLGKIRFSFNFIHNESITTKISIFYITSILLFACPLLKIFLKNCLQV